MKQPFTLDEARAAGMTHKQLRGRSWRRLGRELYCSASLPRDPKLLLDGLSRRLPPQAAFAGRTAAWLHGLDVTPFPVEVVIPFDAGVSDRPDVVLHRAKFEGVEIVLRRGLRTTSAVRTVADVARTGELVESVVLADMATHNRRVTIHQLSAFAASHARWPGIRQLRRVIDLAEPKAESPMETRLRLLLVLAGLPRPEAQVRLHDARGRFLGRVDLYYPARRLAIEFDGGGHRTSRSLVEDSRRQNGLLAAGYRLLRFTSADVVGRPASVVAEVRAVPLAQ